MLEGAKEAHGAATSHTPAYLSLLLRGSCREALCGRGARPAAFAQSRVTFRNFPPSLQVLKLQISGWQRNARTQKAFQGGNRRCGLATLLRIGRLPA